MSQIQLKQIAGTPLYEPSSPAPVEAMLFYLAQDVSSNGGGSPTQLSVDDAAEYDAFVKAPAALLGGGPKHTGLAWAKWINGGLQDPGVLTVAPDASPPGALVGEPFTTPPTRGIKSLGFDSDTPIATDLDTGGNIQGLVLQYPPQPAVGGRPKSDPPWGGGVLVPLSGALSGCFVSRSLVNDPSGPAPNASARKELFEMSLDPVRPFDPDRTRLRPTGSCFVLEEAPAGTFHLRPIE